MTINPTLPTRNQKFRHIPIPTRNIAFYSLRQSRVLELDLRSPLLYYSHIRITREQGLKHTAK